MIEFLVFRMTNEQEIDAEDALIVSLCSLLELIDVDASLLTVAVTIHSINKGYSTEGLRTLHEECVRGVEEGIFTYD